MTLARSIPIVFSMLLGYATAGGQPVPRVEMLVPGDEYDRSELPPDVEGRWLVLSREAGQSTLRELPIRIESFRDECIDEAPDERSGRRISVPDAPGTIVLFRGLPRIEEGFVEEASGSDDRGKGENVAYDWRGRRVLIRVVPEREGFAVELVERGNVHRLYSTEWQDEGSWSVRWIGDLNQDGEVDLILDATHKYSIDTTRLLLSNRSRDVTTWAEVATFSHTSC